jgi:hypothetical protein
MTPKPDDDEDTDPMINFTCKLRSDWKKIQFQSPEKWNRTTWVLSALLSLCYVGMCVGYIVLFCRTVIGDGTREWKGVCTDLKQMRNYTCVLAVGQMSFGIFTIGQISIGML